MAGNAQGRTLQYLSYAYDLVGNITAQSNAATVYGAGLQLCLGTAARAEPDRAYSYDLNGNQTGWDHVSNGTRRTIVWDEENRIQSVADNGRTQTYKYDDAGERVIKRGAQGDTAYVNQFFTVRNREVSTMHVFAGGTRMVSKLVRQPRDVDGDGVVDPIAGCANEPWGWTNGNGNGPCGNNGNGNGGGNGPEVYEKDQYFYHPDHLGSSSYVTDVDGEIFQHLEYFPFGETWVEESSNTQRTPCLFTGKELDEQTGLYYFGARYYDPRTSVWQSPDPILASYMSGGPAGGVFTPPNLALYSYVHHHPVVAHDPDGEFLNFVIGAVAGAAIDLAVQGALVATGVQDDINWTMSRSQRGPALRVLGYRLLSREMPRVSAQALLSRQARHLAPRQRLA